MSVFKQNPFLAGFGVVMLLGVGSLGYLGYSAMDENTKARSEYDNALQSLKGLQNSPVYPSEENLKEIKALKLAVQGTVDGLQRSVAATQIPLDPIGPTAFQDKLRDLVVSIADRSVEAKVKFPGNERDQEKFYLGFEKYKSTVPKPTAAQPLYRQLRAIELVLNLILAAKNTEVLELTRPEINEEKDIKPVAPDPKAKPKPGVDPGKRQLIERQSFTIRFVTNQANFQKIFNGIVGAKEQLFVVRNLAIHNQAQEPPTKAQTEAAAGGGGAVATPGPVSPVTPPPGGAAATPAIAAPPGAAAVPGAPVAPGAPAAPGAPVVPGAPAPGAPAAPTDTGQKQFIFGKELIEASLQIDIVDVEAPPAPTAPVEKGAPKKKTP